ncbi:MAG: AIR synthase family protein [Gemmatimonadota bacterium]|nr:MAG: AIR synthase family protein [Gemmatimonadota bacterium]
MHKEFATGKLNTDSLGALLKRYCHVDESVIVGPKIGEDAAVIDLGDRCLVATTDPITFATDEIGWYSVHINANDIASMGAKPKWFLATVLLPEGETSEALVESIFSQISSACQNLGISLCGGHTEITSGIDRTIVVGHMLGEVAKSKLVISAGARSGDNILLTKGIAIEATSIMARERREELGHDFSHEFLERCRGFLRDPGIGVVLDAEIATQSADVHAMHDPTEGGLAMGLYELCEAADVGVLIKKEHIPIFPETMQLCNHFHLDPLGSIASGALLICLASEDTANVVEALQSEGVRASVIGTVTDRKFGVKMEDEGKIRDLPRFERDEITKLFEPVRR